MENLSRDDFLKRICDYENGGPWEYLGKKPCVIDFYDEACPPCQAIKPVLERVSEDYRERVDFFAVDIRKEERLAKELGIEHMPTLVLCPREGAPLVMKGMASREQLSSKIEEELFTQEDIGQ